MGEYEQTANLSFENVLNMIHMYSFQPSNFEIN